MAMPAIDSIKCARPDAVIEVWCGAHSQTVFEQHPGIHRLKRVPDVPRARDLPKLAAQLRISQPDMLIVLDRSRLLEGAARLSGCGILATVARETPANRHEIDCYLETLRSIGIAASSTTPAITLTKVVRDSAAGLLPYVEERYVVLHPAGAENPGSRMPSKRWPIRSWVEIVNWLASRGVGVVLSGSGAERSLCLEVAARSAPGLDRISIVAGKAGLMESVAIVARAAAFVGPDTGMSHLAAATGTPTIAIFGPTNPGRYAPRGQRVVILAPSESWSIADRDLRRHFDGLPETAGVSATAVIHALQNILGATGTTTPC